MSLTAPLGTTPSGHSACNAAPLAQSKTGSGDIRSDVVLSLPGIHCAGCISGVERALRDVPGVRAARVNLSRKRATIEAKDVEPETLVSALSDAGYEAHVLDGSLLYAPAADDAAQALLVRLAVAGFALMNVMPFSVAVWSGAAATTQVLFHWISAGIAIPALIYSAQVFATSAWSALRVGRLNMDVPITLAIILASGLSVFETMQAGNHVYFDAALSLTFFLLIGRYLDQRSRAAAARSATRELSALETPRGSDHRRYANPCRCG
jgi:Cu2+-exporting ATPase